MPRPVSAVTLLDSHESILSFGIPAIDNLIGDVPHNSQICISAEDLQDTTPLITSIAAQHLKTYTTDVSVLDCANSFDVKALKQRLDQDAQESLPLLNRIKILRAFDLTEARDGMDKISANVTPGQSLLIINGLSQVARSNTVQSTAVLDALLRSAQHLTSKDTAVIVADRFVPDNGIEDDECILEGTGQRSFFHALNAPTMDLRLHIHRAGTEKILELVRDRYNGSFSTCTQLKP